MFVSLIIRRHLLASSIRLKQSICSPIAIPDCSSSLRRRSALANIMPLKAVLHIASNSMRARVSPCRPNERLFVYCISLSQSANYSFRKIRVCAPYNRLEKAKELWIVFIDCVKQLLAVFELNDAYSRLNKTGVNNQNVASIDMKS